MNKPRTTNKYLHLVNYLSRQIRNGQLKAGDRLPTFVELQAAFSVTSPTVNRAMIELEQKGLVERRRGSGIYVSAQSKSAPARNWVIGLAGFGFQFGGQSLYWSELLAGIREEAARTGTQILLLDYNSSAGWEKADGFLICDWTNSTTLHYVPHSAPCVSVLVAVEGVASVVANEFEGMRSAVRHLLQLGHTRVAYLHGPRHTNTTQRIAAYDEALRSASIETQAEWKRLLLWEHDHEEDFFRAGRFMMADWLRDNWDQLGCTALLCQNDETALGAIEALREAGLSVPHDVSVVGFDGLAIGEYFSPRLTTVKMPLREIGASAVKLLNSQIETDAVSTRHEILGVRLHANQSATAPK
jgi:DNA-binding LacI/PurR family transcriptional regulator